MNVDMNAMKAEIGGAFVLSWMVFGMGPGIGSLGGAIALAVVWMAFSGAHVLPVVTWSHMMTGDMGDTEGNWMPNGMRLLAQAVGALLAIILVTEGKDAGWEATEMWIPDIADNLWSVVGMIAAGAVWWQVHTRCNSAWASAFGMMVLGGAMTLNGAHEMGASLASLGAGIADTLVNWIFDGLFVGLGALIGAKIDEMV